MPNAEAVTLERYCEAKNLTISGFKSIKKERFHPEFKGGMTYDSFEKKCHNGAGKDTRR